MADGVPCHPTVISCVILLLQGRYKASRRPYKGGALCIPSYRLLLLTLADCARHVPVGCPVIPLYRYLGAAWRTFITFLLDIEGCTGPGQSVQGWFAANAGLPW